MAIDIHGVCDPRFERLKAAFVANFEADLELGASIAATWRGEPVVDRGAFGSPTFFVGTEMFFGKEQLREVEEMVTGK